MHEDSVTSLVFSPDGARLATASLDRTVRVWDVRSGRTLGPPLRHEDSIGEVAFVEEGKRIITSTGELVRAWDLRPEKPLVPDFLSIIDGAAGATAFSLDSSRVAMVSLSTTTVRDSKTGQPIGASLKLDDDETPVCATFSPDGSRLLIGCSNNTARIWDVKSGQRSHLRCDICVKLGPPTFQATERLSSLAVRIRQPSSGMHRLVRPYHRRCATLARSTR